MKWRHHYDPFWVGIIALVVVLFVGLVAGALLQ